MVTNGTPVEKLISLVGTPSYETDGTRWVEPQHEKHGDQVVADCKRELWYKAWFSPFPSKWSYCFDSSGMLLQKYRWSSW